ncbi:MAG: ABC transporter ATP-binding protein [Gammaproteobacteria bacterium]|nr:ABC transporter ATP-binding protein [Gammaproteobacteria bacterium]
MKETPLVIDVRGLKKSFCGKPAVIDAALQVKKGEIFGFLGPNGAGKTTTIRMLCGLLLPDAALGTCLGFNVLTESYEIKKRVGYMTQRFSLYGDLSIYENLDFVARLYNVIDRKAAVANSIAELGLTERKNQLAGTLSGGWKQRLALSAALIHKPDLLLLDEPTAGVDPKARREFWARIQDLSLQGVTTLVSTHYMDEAERCNKLAYIFQGQIMTQGTSREIVAGSKLLTWQVTGDGNLNRLAEQLKNMPGVEQAAAFGSRLHVSGTDANNLQTSINGLDKRKWRWQQICPDLEDVFIKLSSGDCDAA